MKGDLLTGKVLERSCKGLVKVTFYYILKVPFPRQCKLTVLPNCQLGISLIYLNIQEATTSKLY